MLKKINNNNWYTPALYLTRPFRYQKITSIGLIFVQNFSFSLVLDKMSETDCSYPKTLVQTVAFIVCHQHCCTVIDLYLGNADEDLFSINLENNGCILLWAQLNYNRLQALQWKFRTQSGVITLAECGIIADCRLPCQVVKGWNRKWQCGQLNWTQSQRCHSPETFTLFTTLESSSWGRYLNSSTEKATSVYAINVAMDVMLAKSLRSKKSAITPVDK